MVSKSRKRIGAGVLAALLIVIVWLLWPPCPEERIVVLTPLPVGTMTFEAYFGEEKMEIVDFAAEETTPAATAPTPPEWHTVAPRDKLSTITKQYQQWYDFTWQELCVHNRNQLGGDCHNIQPGWRLNLVVTDESKALAKRAPQRYFEPKLRYVVVDCAKAKLGYCVFARPGGDPVCKRDAVAILARDFGISKAVAGEWSSVPKERGMITKGSFINGLSFGGGYWKGPVKVMQDMQYQKGEIGGQVVGQFDDCCNFFPMDPESPPAQISAPAPVSTAEQPREPVVAEVVTPPEPAAAPASPAPLSAFPQTTEVAEWEAIVGAGVWDNRLAHGRWHYGEGMLSAILPDGYRAGVGLFGMWGSGESETSPYTWKEKGVGPQIGLKRNFLKGQVDQFGQTALLPAGWGLKARFLRDSVAGGNPESGYSMSQAGRKTGLYAEYLERRSPDWMVGGAAEIWRSHSSHITSTWSGDTPQDRGSASVSLWAQYRHNDDWQTRGVVTLAHQNWDQLNLLRGGAELRYKETVMCGPSVALALNKPAAYAEVSKRALTTRGFSCRLELGGIIRTTVREADEATVERIGQVPDAATPPPD